MYASMCPDTSRAAKVHWDLGHSRAAFVIFALFFGHCDGVFRVSAPAGRQQKANADARQVAEHLTSDSMTAFGSRWKGDGSARPRLIAGIGVEKGGSTAVSSVLAMHDGIFHGCCKEKKYFPNQDTCCRSTSFKDRKKFDLEEFDEEEDDEEDVDEEEDDENEAKGLSLVQPGLVRLRRLSGSTSVQDDPDEPQNHTHHKCWKKTTASEVDVAPVQRYIDLCFFGRAPNASQVMVDFTPTYVNNDQNPAIFERLGQDMDIRFLVVLRDPVERLVSFVNMQRKNGKTDLDDKQLNIMIEDMLTNHSMGNHSMTIAKGEYAHHLRRWVNTFGEDKLLIVNNEALGETDTWTRIFRHTGLSEPNAKTLKMWMKIQKERYEFRQKEKYSAAGTAYFVPSEHTLARLRKYYKPHDAKLWKMIGVRWWGKDDEAQAAAKHKTTPKQL